MLLRKTGWSTPKRSGTGFFEIMRRPFRLARKHSGERKTCAPGLFPSFPQRAADDPEEATCRSLDRTATPLQARQTCTYRATQSDGLRTAVRVAFWSYSFHLIHSQSNRGGVGCAT